jgi:hypothetical protein
MENNHTNQTEEINEIVASMQSEFPGYIYNNNIVCHKGPGEYKTSRKTINLSDNEAIIGLREPISRMAQHPILHVARESPGKWRLIDIILSITKNK